MTVAEAKAYYILMGLTKILEALVAEKDYETLDFLANELYNLVNEIKKRKVMRYELE